MAFVVLSKNFEVRRQFPASEHVKLIPAKGFPTFYSNSGEYLLPVNLWLNYLVNIRRDKDINSSVRAIKRYWNFLEQHDLAWDEFPTAKSLKPTYRYRNEDLLHSARKGDIQFSTASLYMLHVIKFYEWCMYERLISVDNSSKPFEYETVRVSNKGMLRHINQTFCVLSTDLRIKKPVKSEEQSLNPLSQDELFAFVSCLVNFNEEFIIQQLLQLQSGLRLEEACSFPLELVHKPPQGASRIEVEIGPHNGVMTKNNKIRKVEIVHSLMMRMYLYSISDRRNGRALKSQDNSTRLLLNPHGQPINSNSTQQNFRRLREKIRSKFQMPFIHRTHDLRATYGTYKLASLLEHLQPSDAMALVMNWMGHKDEKTTWRYLRYLNKECAQKKAICILDQLFDEVLNEPDIR